MKQTVDLSSMAKRWPSTYVARCEIGKFTGGIIQPRTIANLDTEGKEPDGRFRVGQKVAYPVENFIKWMENRSQLLK